MGPKPHPLVLRSNSNIRIGNSVGQRSTAVDVDSRSRGNVLGQVDNVQTTHDRAAPNMFATWLYCEFISNTVAARHAGSSNQFRYPQERTGVQSVETFRGSAEIPADGVT